MLKLTRKQAAKTTHVFRNDPGHGWLCVGLPELAALGLKPKHFSQYSYHGGTHLALEEDIDAGIYLARFRALNGHRALIVETHTNGDEPIRSWPHNAAGWPMSDCVSNWPAVSIGAIPELRRPLGYAASGTFAHADGLSHDD